MAIIMPTTLACKPKEEQPEPKPIYGIAVYQKDSHDKMWNTYLEKQNKANKLILTENDLIVYEDIPSLLLFVYSKSEITPESKPEDFLTNTTMKNPIIGNNKIEFEIEKGLEVNEILIYYIYKSEETYYLVFDRHLTNVADGTALELKPENSSISKITIKFRNNISTTEKY